MTAAELLKPRFEVIADFPDNHYGKVGTILDRDWACYPNDDENEEVYDIIDWDMKHLNGIIDTKSRSVCSLTLFVPLALITKIYKYGLT